MSLTRVAVGRLANLFDFYDVRTDTLYNTNCLKAKPSENQIESFDLDDDSVSEIINSGSFTTAANCLKIECDLQASILAGLAKPNVLFKDILLSKCNDSLTAIYRINTEHEELIISQVKQDINKEVLDMSCENATHVIVGIDYGAHCIITGEYSSNRQETGKLESLKENLISLTGRLSDSSAGKDNSNNVNQNDFRFTINSELMDDGCSCSSDSYSEAMTCASTISSTLKQTDRSRGVPILYHLKPIDQVMKICRFQDLSLTSIVRYSSTTNTDEKVLTQCRNFLEIIHQLDTELVNKLHVIYQYKDLVNAETQTEIEDIGRNIALLTTDYRSQFKAELIRWRSDHQMQADKAIQEMHDSFRKKILHLHQRIGNIESLTSRLDQTLTLKEHGFIIISHSDVNCLKTHRNCFVLYVRTISACSAANFTFNVFLKLFAIHNSKISFLIVLQDFAPNHYASLSKGATAEGIYLFKNGELIFDDVINLVTSETSVCLIDSTPHQPNSSPARRATVRLMFTNEFYQNNSDNYKPLWMCRRCQTNIEYGLDTNLIYCQCGESDLRSIRFFATDLLRYSTDVMSLKSMLDKLPPQKVINILILGETGVGKSTWINGIFNYFLYESLEEACKQEVQAPIPSKFQVEGHTIFVGKKSLNENVSCSGESCTQQPRQYEMRFRNYKINVIDTPGVGDGRGIQRDKQNFDNILSFLTNYSQLHAVCILMKPNITRNSIWFRFCIEELLTHLHSSIVKNIVFCFTNARSTFYKPGDTLPVLQEYLSRRKISLEANPQRNCFCFDNEAFRYLACLKQGMHNMQERFSSFDESWNLARKETIKLLHYVCNLEPHEIALTISVNSAREAVLQIAKPLAELVNKIIPHNIDKANKTLESLTNSKKQIGKLEENLTIEGKSFQVEPLDYPKTVCTGDGCWHFERAELKGKELKKVYHQTCHNQCTIEGLPTEAANDERLSTCYAFHVDQIKLLIRFLKLKSENDIPGYRYNQCKNKKCLAFEGESHGHCDVDDSVRNRLTTRQRETYDREISDLCQFCGHSYKLHMHITYDLKTVPKTFIQPDVQEQIRGLRTEEDKLKALSNVLNQTVKEYESERELIFNSLARFGAFIKSNALIPYNDAYEEYVKLHIREEESKSESYRDNKLLAQLKRDHQIYMEKKRAIDEAIRPNKRGLNSSSSLTGLTPENILLSIDSLKRLKHSGKALQEALDGIVLAKRRQHTLMSRMWVDREQTTNIVVVPDDSEKSSFYKMFKYLKLTIGKVLEKNIKF